MPKDSSGFVAACWDAAEMAEYRRLNLTLNLEVPIHRQTWNFLSGIPRGYRTDAVCRAVLAQRDQEAMVQKLREVMREELKHFAITEKTEQRTAGDVDEHILGFLRAFQEGDDEP